MILEEFKIDYKYSILWDKTGYHLIGVTGSDDSNNKENRDKEVINDEILELFNQSWKDIFNDFGFLL